MSYTAEGDRTGYGRPSGAYLKDLTEVGPGTSCGEFMRRYWHPVGLMSDAGHKPKEVRVLGEDLILFRDKRGRPGLLHARCAHRGTTLYYGKVEDRGIRCCYHGWLFDTEGHCLEQPCEPELGKNRHRVRQPWYPLEERYGLIFAYMGPPERKPVLPRYDALEVMDEGEFVDADDRSIGSGGPVIADCNWLQHWENVMDSFHVPILHGTFSGTQFVELMNTLPKVRWEYSPLGVKAISERATEDGRTFHRITEVSVPTLRVVPSPVVGKYGRAESIGWTLPIDDTHYRIYAAGRVREKGVFHPRRQGDNTKRRNWQDMTPGERRDFPGDYEAQRGQGPITLHSEEHLATTDEGIGKLRRLLAAQIKAVSEGKDPIGVSFDANAQPIRFDAGQYVN